MWGTQLLYEPLRVIIQVLKNNSKVKSNKTNHYVRGQGFNSYCACYLIFIVPGIRWEVDMIPRRRQWHPHSSTLAWKIPWTEEPGGLPSMGSHRVGHD